MTYRFAKLDASGAPLWLREFPVEPQDGDVPADEVHVTDDAEWAALQAKVAAPLTGPRYVPFPIVCGRLRDAGKWEAFAELYASLPVVQQLHLQTLELGIASDDTEFIAGLEAIGADPVEVLA